jgi:hypothetical protein
MRRLWNYLSWKFAYGTGGSCSLQNGASPTTGMLHTLHNDLRTGSWISAQISPVVGSVAAFSFSRNSSFSVTIITSLISLNELDAEALCGVHCKKIINSYGALFDYSFGMGTNELIVATEHYFCPRP